MKRNPYVEAFKLMCGKKPPFSGNPMKLNDEDFTTLQDWACCECGLDWATGMSVIEAICILVDGAKENDNFSMVGDNFDVR